MAIKPDDDGLIRPVSNEQRRLQAKVVPLPTVVDDQGLIRPQVVQEVPVASSSNGGNHLDVLSSPAVQQILDFFRSNEGSVLSSGVLGSALDQLPIETALGYLVEIGAASSDKAKWIAKNGGLVDGSMDAKLAGLDFIIDRVLNLGVLEGERAIKLAQQRGQLAVMNATAGGVIAIAENETQTKVIASGAAVVLAGNDTQTQVIASAGKLADAQADATVATGQRDLTTEQRLTGVKHAAAEGRINAAIKEAEIAATETQLVPVRTKLAQRRVKLQARREEHRQSKEERKFWTKEKYGWIVPIVVVLVVVSNLVADVPDQSDFAILGTINDMWDALYMPIRRGIMNALGKDV